MKIKHHTLFGFGLAFAVGMVLPGCPEDIEEFNPGSCWLNHGDDTCAANEAKFMNEYNEARPFCTNEEMCPGSGANSLGCVAVLPTECYTPCGEKSDDNCGSAEGDGDGDPGDGDGDMTGDGDGDGDGDMPCTEPEDCGDPDAPFCDTDSGECVSCDGVGGDQACAEADAEFPVCLDGACVQCAEGKEGACGGVTPVCDVEASMCVGCSDHGQCPDSACNFVAGNCFDPASVVHVDGDNMNCGMANGSEAMPYCSIGAALTMAGGDIVIILHERTLNPTTYSESITISNDVAIFSADGESPRIQGDGGNGNALNVAASSTLYLRGVEVAGSAGAGAAVFGQAWIDECTIRTSSTHGVTISGGDVVVRRSKIVNNSGGGIVVQGGGMLVLENSFVGGGNDLPGIHLADGTFSILYSTIGANALANTAVQCSDGAGSSIRNSLIVFNNGADPDGGELLCPDVELDNNALEGVFGGTNVPLGNMSTGWFTNLNGGFNVGELFLSGSHPSAINTAARWQAGDPTTDIEGDPRPTTDGSDDYAGADRP